jgi:hypothetical protein
MKFAADVLTGLAIVGLLFAAAVLWVDPSAAGAQGPGPDPDDLCVAPDTPTCAQHDIIECGCGTYSCPTPAPPYACICLADYSLNLCRCQGVF